MKSSKIRNSNKTGSGKKDAASPNKAPQQGEKDPSLKEVPVAALFTQQEKENLATLIDYAKYYKIDDDKELALILTFKGQIMAKINNLTNKSDK